MYNNDADYAAKESAARHHGGAVAGGTISGGYHDGPQPAKPKTITEALIRELDQALDIMHETVQRQDEFQNRMFGPRPPDPSNPVNQTQPNGVFGEVELRLMTLRNLSQRLSDNACSLGRIG